MATTVPNLVYKWEGLLKIVWGGGGLQPPEPPLDPPLSTVLLIAENDGKAIEDVDGGSAGVANR